MGDHLPVDHLRHPRLGSLRPRHQPGVRLLSVGNCRRLLGTRQERTIIVRPRAEHASLCCRVWPCGHRRRAAWLVDRTLARAGSSDRRVHHRRLCHAAGRACALAGAVDGTWLHGESLRRIPDGGVSHRHQHLAWRARGAENPDRGRQELRRLRFHHSAPHRAASHDSLHHGGHQAGGGPWRGGHGHRRILHGDFGAWRDHHQRGQCF